MAVGAFYGNLSVGTFDNRFCDCKAQTITAGFTRTGAVCTVETIEYMGKRFCRNLFPRILDTKNHAVLFACLLYTSHYILAGKSYAESYADENGDFVPQIAAHQEICATAQASVADFVGIFQAIVHQGGEVLCLVISSRLSGAYSSACIAAKAVDAEKVRVVDVYKRQALGRRLPAW